MGPGTELKRLLSKLGINPTEGCPCNQRALVMDEEGPKWCKLHLKIIVGWMREEAETRNLVFIDFPARILILTAIRRAKKKERILSHA